MFWCKIFKVRFVIGSMGLINKSKLRGYLNGLNLGEDLIIELERQVEGILRRAGERAKGNFRRTVYARDL